MMIGLDKKQPFVHYYQKIMIVKEVQKRFGEIYLGKKAIAMDVFFIMENIRIYCQMDAGKF